MNEVLKPCPFCSNKEVELCEDYNNDWFVICNYCYSSTGHYNDGYTGKTGKEKAIQAWNERHKKPAEYWVD